MALANLGNQLNRIVWDARALLFEQGELAELTYGAFDIAARFARSQKDDEIEITFPVGYRADRTTIPSKRTYKKEELVRKYEHLAIRQLSINAIIQLVTIVEAMLTDVLRAVVVRYPQKLGSKRMIALHSILESTSLEEVHLRACDSLLNDLSYKSPAEFAEELEKLIGIKLLECPAYQRYIEVKASRDIFVHNSGVANAVYVRKAGAYARVRDGETIPADVQYLLESYENCLQIADWLEKELHEHWHSSEFEEREQPQLPLALVKPAEPEALPPPATGNTSKGA
jgi:hypothetical protein